MVRPKIPDSDKRNDKLIIRVSSEEKLRIRTLTKSGKYPCMSDFIRVRIFKQPKKKILSLDDELNAELKQMDYELNKIGVNLNQLSKRINSFAGYNIGENDRKLLRQAFNLMNRCLAFLQKYLR